MTNFNTINNFLWSDDGGGDSVCCIVMSLRFLFPPVRIKKMQSCDWLSIIRFSLNVALGKTGPKLGIMHALLW